LGRSFSGSIHLSHFISPFRIIGPRFAPLVVVLLCSNTLTCLKYQTQPHAERPPHQPEAFDHDPDPNAPDEPPPSPTTETQPLISAADKDTNLLDIKKLNTEKATWALDGSAELCKGAKVKVKWTRLLKLWKNKFTVEELSLPEGTDPATATDKVLAITWKLWGFIKCTKKTYLLRKGDAKKVLQCRQQATATSTKHSQTQPAPMNRHGSSEKHQEDTGHDAKGGEDPWAPF